MKNQNFSYQLVTPPYFFLIISSKKIISALFILLILLASTKKGFSQFLSGYPTSSSPTTTVSYSTIYFMDDTRAHCWLLSSLVPTMDALSLDHISGSFTAGDRVMVIQMISVAGSTTGYFEETTIQSITGGGTSLNIDKLTRTYNTQNSVSSARLQVLKIPRFFKLTNKGVIRCKPWDGYTGGVLCFAAEQVVMDRGIFDVSGTGFGPDNVNWAIKGTPGVGDNFYNGGGGIFSLSNLVPCIVPTPDPIHEFLGNIGTNGDPVPFSSLPILGTPTSLYSSTTAYDYGTPSFSTHKVVMGSAGYFPANQKSGLQGQGGGHGGIGGSDNYINNAGQNGSDGGDASLGGDAGKGAKGGGIILMKVGLIKNDLTATPYIPTTQYNFLLAAGANGDHGKSGGSGGLSGRGGDGGIGAQVGLDIYYSGGNGGNGDYGKAGQGGEGGNGAKAGTIFIYNRDAATSQCFGNAPSPKVGSIDLSSGKGGGKGPGGYTKEITDNLATYPPSLTTPYSACTPSGTPDLDICHCDNAMRPFRFVTQNDYSNQAVLSGNKYTWQFYYDPILGSGTITYDRATGEVLTTSNVGSNTNKYHCKFYKLADANYIFDRFSYHQHNMTLNHIKLPAQPGVLSGGLEIKFLDDYNLFNARYVSQNGNRYIYYEHSPHKVYVDTGACNPNTPGFGSHASQGDLGDLNGDDPEDVLFDYGNPDSHFGFNDNEPFKLPIKPNRDSYELLNMNDNQFQLLRSSTDEQEVLESEGKLIKLELLDLTGKVLWSKNNVNKEVITVENTAKGVYILRINGSINKKVFIK